LQKKDTKPSSCNGRAAASNLRRSEASPVPTHSRLALPYEARRQRVWAPNRRARGDGHEFEEGRLLTKNFQSETHQVIENTDRVPGTGQNNPNSGTDGLENQRIELIEFNEHLED
jgi:hypothetical protein